VTGEVWGEDTGARIAAPKSDPLDPEFEFHSEFGDPLFHLQCSLFLKSLGAWQGKNLIADSLTVFGDWIY
jgi:hypothetical protein